MSRKTRLILLILGGVVLVVILVLLALYMAVRHEPTFYREALEIDPATLEKGSDEMLQQTAALTGAVKKEGDWEALFTTEQINGWLAVDVPKNHPNALPSMLSDPRVAITPDGITIACRFKQDSIDSVLSLTVEPSVPKPNILALRIVSARIGLLPAPLGKIPERLTQAARDMHFRVEWRRSGNDPVAMLAIPDSDGDRTIQVDAIRLGEGEIFIGGSSKAAEEQP